VKWALAIAFGTSLAASACRNQSKPSDAAPPPATATNARSGASEPVTSGTLPEDPDAGARSSAEWRQHLAREEYERRLGYDRRKLVEHQAVLKTLRAARARYDGATTKSAVLSAERDFQATRPKLEKAFDSIDHWGNSSKVLPDYRALAETLSESYPTARIAALSGDPTPFERVGRDVDERFRAVDAWLREAELSEQSEGE